MTKKVITAAELEDAIAMLVEKREYESENLPDSVLIMHYYTMGMEDLYHSVTGHQLDLGQDIEDELDFDEDF